MVYMYISLVTNKEKCITSNKKYVIKFVHESPTKTGIYM